MKVYTQIISCLLLLALTIKKGLSLDCYECNSFQHENCEKVGPGTPVKTCNGTQSVCRKVEQHINYNKEDHIRIFRQCGERGTPSSSCESRTGTYRFKSWYCHCNNKDLCNGSGFVLVSLTTVLVPLIAVVYEVRKYL